MTCRSCGKPIADGPWRRCTQSKGGEHGYVTHHRACSPDDAGWTRHDQRRRDGAVQADRLRAAAMAFRDKWGVSDLDDLIEELTPADAA